MGEDGESSVNYYCYGCLVKNNEIQLCEYNIRSVSLKSIFQTDQLTLCFICKRIAQHTEMFIHNIETNQKLMENFFNMNNLKLESLPAQSQPIMKLVGQSLDVLKIGGPNSSDTRDMFAVNYYCNRSRRIKKECDIYSSNFEDLPQGSDDDNNRPETIVKKENENPLQSLEIELEEVEETKKMPMKNKPKKTVVKPKKVKKGTTAKKGSTAKKGTGTGTGLGIEYVNLSHEQFMKERERKMKDVKYINATYKCEDCVKSFKFKISFEKHMENHNKTNGEYECEICKQRMESDERLKRHMTFHYLRHRCKECGLTRINRRTVRDHFIATHGQGHCYSSCPHCGKFFQGQLILARHIKKVHEESRERFQCAYCDKNYARKYVLMSHMTKSHSAEGSIGKVKKRHTCDECGAVFRDSSRLMRHSTKHSERRDHYCVECNKSYKSPRHLKLHLRFARAHRTGDILKLQCSHCDKRYAKKRDLERHQNSVHLNIKPFKCDRCDKAYLNSWVLKQHKLHVHEGYKRPYRFPCQICGRMFNRKEVLANHLRTHTGEKPFLCTKCPAQFNQAGTLVIHVRAVHLNQTRDGRPK